MAIDPTISDQLLASYRNAITAALDSQDRRRFQTIIKLAKQADALLGMQAERVADFNADFNNQAPDGDNLGDLIARPIAMDDMPRQIFGALAPLLQAQAEKTKADSASGAGDRLESLLRSRALLKAQKLDYKEIDAAIVVARKELCDAVVSSELLRGHSDREDAGNLLPGVVGETDASGKGGAGTTGEGGDQTQVGRRP